VRLSLVIALPELGSSATPHVLVVVLSVEVAVILPFESSTTLQNGSGFSPSRRRVAGLFGRIEKLAFGIENRA
jgi:hypothetical protein